MADQNMPSGRPYRLLLPVILLLLGSFGVALTVHILSQSAPARGGATMTPGMVIERGDMSAAQSGGATVVVPLSEGRPQPQASPTLPAATGEPLSVEEISQILSRLPALTQEPWDQTAFNLPPEPLPPPRAGAVVTEAFPPQEAAVLPTPQPAGPLQVLRYSPEGEISIAPFVSVTFNQPMAPLAGLGELSAGQVPVRLTPPLPGTWRWLGTSTLTFEYDSELIDRLPKATQYRVTIPAGTKSAAGGALAESVEFTFTTPTARLVSGYPSNTPPTLDPVFFAAFDQRLDPSAVLKTIHVTAGGQPVSLHLASAAEIQADRQASSLVKNAKEGRWLAFKAGQPLPKNTPVSITIGPGTPSAEGPLVTTDAQGYSFQTYAPLNIERYSCAWGNQACPPFIPFYIAFNNPLEKTKFNENLFRIEPAIPGVSIGLTGNTVTITGNTRAHTTYTITVSGEVQDIFGQKLGQDTRLTFQTGEGEKMLLGPGQQGEAFLTLDPSLQKPVFPVYSINYPRLDVKIYAVQPADWPAYKDYLQNWRRSDVTVQMPGRLVYDQTLNVEAPVDELAETDIDLSQHMDGKYGHFVVMVTPPRGLFENEAERLARTVIRWAQITQIGLDAFTDHSDMLAWATALKDGSPLSGVSVQAGPAGPGAVTAKDGLARLSLPSTGFTYLVASKGSDQALLPSTIWMWGDQPWTRAGIIDELRWYVFDDRQMYRPGEEVHVKGWLRRIGGGQNGDVSLVGAKVSSVRYQVFDAQGNAVTNGQAQVNALGGIDLVFKLPAEINLGYTRLALNAEGDLSGMLSSEYSHGFQVQEFRRPEFEVKARNETPGPYFNGGEAVVSVQASYYAGGSLPNAPVTWHVSSYYASYSPPKWPDFVFGQWQPWWLNYRAQEAKPFYNGEFAGPVPQAISTETFSGQTDATGAHYLHLDLGKIQTTRPISISAAASVMDVNRQAWTGSTNLLVHPASLYVGLRSARYFVERGAPLKIDFIVSDLDGNPVSDRPVEVRAARLEWKYQDNEWQEVEADAQTCRMGSGQEPVTCEFQTKEGGTYRIVATVTDAQGRLNETRILRWVSGGKQPSAQMLLQESVTLVPDKESYQPGDVAHILVQSPFSPAEGLLTVGRSGLVYTQSFRVEDGAATLDVPILEEHIPNLNVQVDLVGSAPRTDKDGNAVAGAPPRPAFASGQLNLSIPPLTRTLNVKVTPDDTELEPGGATNLTVAVKDAGGRPVQGAEVAVVAVDEAILALTGYRPDDPLSVFYSERSSGVSSTYGRTNVLLSDARALAQAGLQDLMMREAFMAPAPAATQAAGLPHAGGGEAGQAPIPLRIDFNPLALFAPAVQTAADGAARVSIQLPDNLTRYRILAVTVAEGRYFGMTDANLTARLPLMVRPSAPRFLNFGDQFELPVVLQNQTGEPLSVAVAVRAGNLVLTGPAGLRVQVPAHDRVEVRFPARADQAGTARIQVAAVAGVYQDAAALELPVYTPATTEAFAAYGVIDRGAAIQPVKAPAGVFEQFGGLQITTSSTALQALTDAVLYLVAYPYECSEQLASRILAVAALRDVLTAFKAEGLPAPADMESAVTRDVNRLANLQNDDGGFPYWARGYPSVPFNTIHAAYALQMAKAKGFAVPADMQERILAYLREIESHYPDWYDASIRQTLSAYALYVRGQMGDRDPAKARKLIDQAGGVEKLSLDAIGWLWPVLQEDPASTAQLEAIRRLAANRVVETAGAANFTTSYNEQNYLLLGSNRRTDAILLNALMGDNPDSDLIPKVVNGLLAHRSKGRWGNTQENVFVLLALDRYFNTYEAQTPDFVARIWLGDTYAASHEYQGRTTERIETNIPMAALQDLLPGGTAQNLIVSKEGAGRLYYRLGLSYAPTDLTLEPLDMGFIVQREYVAVDDPQDVTRDADGTWHIKAGARVRVRVTMEAKNRRYHVALVDPLPAGLEIVNPALSVSSSNPPDPNQPYRYGWWSWFEYQNLRDERAEAFTSLLWDGGYTYTYFARATTPGRFVVPPAKAEEMYSPEVFGRSGSDVVIVE